MGTKFSFRGIMIGDELVQAYESCIFSSSRNYPCDIENYTSYQVPVSTSNQELNGTVFFR